MAVVSVAMSGTILFGLEKPADYTEFSFEQKIAIASNPLKFKL
jgi:hypothetical protein